jgi:hypothetical protein
VGWVVWSPRRLAGVSKFRSSGGRGGGQVREWKWKAFRACLGISRMNGNQGYWGGGISIISQNFSKSLSILFHPLDSSISQTSPYYFPPSLLSHFLFSLFGFIFSYEIANTLIYKIK